MEAMDFLNDRGKSYGRLRRSFNYDEIIVLWCIGT